MLSNLNQLLDCSLCPDVASRWQHTAESDCSADRECAAVALTHQSLQQLLSGLCAQHKHPHHVSV